MLGRSRSHTAGEWPKETRRPFHELLELPSGSYQPLTILLFNFIWKVYWCQKQWMCSSILSLSAHLNVWFHFFSSRHTVEPCVPAAGGLEVWMWVFTAAWERAHGEEVTSNLGSKAEWWRDRPHRLPLLQTHNTTPNKMMNFLPHTIKRYQSSP